jgi:hypothetical protein
MLKATPEDRVVLWKDAVDSNSDVRSHRLRLLAKEAQEAVAGPLDMYDHDALFEETFALLGATGLFGRDVLRIAFEEVDQSQDGPARLIEVLAELLEDGVEDPHLNDEQRVRSAELSEAWRELLAAAPMPAIADYWTVADVAAHFGVSPQAVYRWIEKDKIAWRRRPGGSYLIPAAQFDDIEPMTLNEATRRRGPTPDAQLRARLRRARVEAVDPAEAVDSRDPASSFARPGSAPRRRPLRRSAR